jgi:hypothetical protein
VGGSGLLDRSGSHGTFLDTILKGIARSLRMGKIFAPAGEVQRKLTTLHTGLLRRLQNLAASLSFQSTAENVGMRTA